jgi:putative FmdB family regulatory protein
MANYEYHCKDCKATFTVHEPISRHTGRKRPKCPQCGGHRTEQLFSSFFAKTSSKS